MTYVRVTDIAATWADYVPQRGLTESAGLIVFAAGPTDEGIRTVEVWASPTDWAHARRAAGPVPEHTNSTTREFEAPVSVLGLLGAHSAMEEPS